MSSTVIYIAPSQAGSYIDPVLTGFIDLGWDPHIVSGKSTKGSEWGYNPDIPVWPTLESLSKSALDQAQIILYDIASTRIHADDSVYLDTNKRLSKYAHKLGLVHYEDNHSGECPLESYEEDISFSKLFMRESTWYHPKIISMPFLALVDRQLKLNDQVIPQDQERNIDVSCLLGRPTMGPKTGYARYGLVETMMGWKDAAPGINIISGFFADLKREDYLSALCQSKISVACWGTGYQCWRDWEIISMGALIAWKKSPLPWMDSMQDMKNCILWDSPVDLINKCEILLSDKNLYNDVCTAYQEMLQAYHLPVHRAQKIVDEMLVHTPSS